MKRPRESEEETSALKRTSIFNRLEFSHPALEDSSAEGFPISKDVLGIVFSLLSALDLCRSSCVCKLWNTCISSAGNLWKVLYLQKWSVSIGTSVSSWKNL